jgi:hypothetical protein
VKKHGSINSLMMNLMPSILFWDPRIIILQVTVLYRIIRSFNSLLRSSNPRPGWQLPKLPNVQTQPSILFWDPLSYMLWGLGRMTWHLQFSFEILAEHLAQVRDELSNPSILFWDPRTKWLTVSVPDNDPSILFWDPPGIVRRLLNVMVNEPSILFWDPPILVFFRVFKFYGLF